MTTNTVVRARYQMPLFLVYRKTARKPPIGRQAC